MFLTVILATLMGAVVMVGRGYAADEPQPLVSITEDDTPAPKVIFDIDRTPRTPFEIMPNVSVGAELRFDIKYAENLDLDNSAGDVFGVFEPRPEFYLSIDPDQQTQIFLRLKITDQLPLTADAEGEAAPVNADVQEIYLALRDVWEGTTLQIGRQKTRDPREWLFNQAFNSLRVYWRNNPFAVQAFVGTIGPFFSERLRRDLELDSINYFVGAYFAPEENSQVGAYGFFLDDLTEDNNSPYFLGVQASGETDFRLGYWLDAAHVGGHDGDLDIDGYGVDAGLFYTVDVPIRLTLIGGYAYGSSDFRQTGFQENKYRFRGVTNFQVYGELFNPELSNMAITTAGIGVRPTANSSIDLVYHHYRQVTASDEIRSSSLSVSPNGVSTDLGDELDLVLGSRDIENLVVKIVGSVFFPGSAFPGADNAYFMGFEAKYTF